MVPSARREDGVLHAGMASANSIDPAVHGVRNIDPGATGVDPVEEVPVGGPEVFNAGPLPRHKRGRATSARVSPSRTFVNAPRGLDGCVSDPPGTRPGHGGDARRARPGGDGFGRRPARRAGGLPPARHGRSVRRADGRGVSGWYRTTAKNTTIRTLRPKLAPTFSFIRPAPRPIPRVPVQGAVSTSSERNWLRRRLEPFRPGSNNVPFAS